MELQTRKLVERGKRIVQRELGLSEHEALLVLQRQSQQRMKAIILSAEVRQSIATD
jgi:AmiR/NasT family two-component response regulator